MRAGKFKVVNTPFRFSRSQCRIEQAFPDLGGHTEEVLTGLLGMTEEEINKLKEQCVM
jgi:crotonobetainyl-CoA:carnitine CoA-transferase CaiB-like acyl-CoA transferase